MVHALKDRRPCHHAIQRATGDFFWATVQVHNDLHQHVGGGRRLAVVTQMSTSNWYLFCWRLYPSAHFICMAQFHIEAVVVGCRNEGCGGALVWCDPVDVIPPVGHPYTLLVFVMWCNYYILFALLCNRDSTRWRYLPPITGNCSDSSSRCQTVIS